MSLVQIRKLIAELGRREAALYILARLLDSASRGRIRLVRYQFVAQPVPASPQSTSRPSTTSRIRSIDADDPIVPAFPRPPAVIAQRFADGANCFVAESRERFAGFIWLKRDAYEEDEIRCRYEFVPPGRCAWDYDVYVEPEFRIGRTFSRLWETANAHLAADGVRWSLSRISAFNPGSLAAHRRLGIRPLCAATFLVAGPIQLSFLPQPPYLHLGTGPQSRPVLRLSAPDT